MRFMRFMRSMRSIRFMRFMRFMRFIRSMRFMRSMCFMRFMCLLRFMRIVSRGRSTVYTNPNQDKTPKRRHHQLPGDTHPREKEHGRLWFLIVKGSQELTAIAYHLNPKCPACTSFASCPQQFDEREGSFASTPSFTLRNQSREEYAKGWLRLQN